MGNWLGSWILFLLNLIWLVLGNYQIHKILTRIHNNLIIRINKMPNIYKLLDLTCIPGYRFDLLDNLKGLIILSISLAHPLLPIANNRLWFDLIPGFYSLSNCIQ